MDENKHVAVHTACGCSILTKFAQDKAEERKDESYKKKLCKS